MNAPTVDSSEDREIAAFEEENLALRRELQEARASRSLADSHATKCVNAALALGTVTPVNFESFYSPCITSTPVCTAITTVTNKHPTSTAPTAPTVPCSYATSLHSHRELYPDSSRSLRSSSLSPSSNSSSNSALRLDELEQVLLVPIPDNSTAQLLEPPIGREPLATLPALPHVSKMELHQPDRSNVSEFLSRSVSNICSLLADKPGESLIESSQEPCYGAPDQTVVGGDSLASEQLCSKNILTSRVLTAPSRATYTTAYI